MTAHVYAIQVIRHGFQGCIGQVRILTQQTPHEIWSVMDWSKAIEQRDAYPAWHGCPVSLEIPTFSTATHFPGRGTSYINIFCISVTALLMFVFL